MSAAGVFGSSIFERLLFTEDFGRFSVGAGLPASFTNRWVSTNITYAIQDLGGVSGNWLKFTASTTARRAVSFDRPGNAEAAMEVLVLVMALGAAIGSSIQCGVALRVSGAAASETGYGFGLATTAGPTRNIVRPVKYVAGAVVDLASSTFVWNLNTPYWIRFRAIGSALKGKVWAAGDPEPGAWTSEVTDTGVAGAGYAACYSVNADADPVFDFISVAFGGLTAPKPAWAP